MSCPFCDARSIAVIAENPLAFAFRDRYPVSPGHTLVVTRRHVADFFGCTPDERVALLDLVDRVKADLDLNWARVDGAGRQPDGYNVGFNAGDAAGQTVMHVHVHVIPRFRGDVEDPRGGVRYVIPDKANYLRDRAQILTDGALGGSFYPAVAPLFARATRIDILAAFVQDSGLAYIQPAVRDALARGARLRILTGDYLDITQVDALRRLADWAGANAAEQSADETEQTVSGDFQARVVETKRLRRAFHPKAWHLQGPDFGVAFVGSSNLSRSALDGGIEWNLRVDRHRDPQAWNRVSESYDLLWNAAQVIDADWIAAYALRARAHSQPLPPGEVTDQAPLALPEPTPLQRQALEALAATRGEARQRALIVMATGLGKTVLAALDIACVARGGEQLPSILWLAHRRELLEQAAGTLRCGLPAARFAWMLGGAQPTEPFDVLFASVQTLSRDLALKRFPRDRFDYIVVDEVHHADAPSYRRILAHFQPRFLLGLTATPERADGGDIPGLFDDHVPFRADVGVGINEGLLVPFAYFGLADTTVDYEQRGLWRNGRFDVDELTTALGTDARMDKLWSVWNEPGKTGSRTMVFCVSIRHAAFVRDWLAARGVRVRLCHGGADSDDRTVALQDLEVGTIDAICSVDLFNEGIDCRPLDRVVMLRPTESPVLFLQQLGRGLRNSVGKARLVVIDFVGNHRIFLDRVRRLISLGAAPQSVQSLVATRTASSLPSGCIIDFELEAIDILRRLLPGGGTTNALVAAYRELAAARSERPTAGEMVRRGFSIASLLTRHEGWFGFVDGEGGLTDAERAVLETSSAWLRDLQTTPMTRCFKMVVLEVLLDEDALFTGLDVPELAMRCHAYLLRSPELFEDLDGVRELAEPRDPPPALWEAYWRRNPITAWCNGPWFTLNGARFQPRLPRADPEALAAMTRELVDARLATYRRRRSEGSAIDAKIWQNTNGPIIRLPSGVTRGGLPRGEADVRLPDGTPWRFRFVDIAINVAHPVGRDRNELPDLLRRWFGPQAGRPGTDFRVRFRPSPDGWWIEPLGEVVALATERGRFVCYPSLKAAAGRDGAGDLDPAVGEVLLPGPISDRQFAVRVSGNSMDGGVNPLRDGDWAIFEWARGLGIGAVEGKVSLVGVGAEEEGPEFFIKRVVREGSGFVLRSDNPEVEPRPATHAVVYARFVRAVRPEALAPGEGDVVPDIQTAFGLSEVPTGPVARVDGHLFLLAEGRDVLDAPDRWSIRTDRGPGETAYVLVRADASAPWRYLGVGRWQSEESAWSFPAASQAAWRLLSSGRSASRTLVPLLLERAARVAAEAGDRLGGVWLERGGQRGRVVGRAAQGGLRVDGGDGGFAERTVSLVDIGWVLAAVEDVRLKGGVLDEARVNKLRYLDGTAKGATRWIDTGWALAIVVALNLAETTVAGVGR